MQNAEELSQEQIRDFLKSSESIECIGQNRAELYGWVPRVLVGQEYAVQGSKQRGAIRAYLSKVTGLSLPQMTRLIRPYRQEGVVKAAAYRRRRFAVKYQKQDIALLAEVDRAHDWLSGPATVRIVQREHEQFGQVEFAPLAEISVAHRYNPRRSAGYRKMAAQWEPTRPGAITIGERRKPDPQGRPGFLRIDSVHPGDWEGAKGVYHIHAVDAVRQWQVVGCVGRINEQSLLPVWEAMLHQFPFKILGFHSDNGSEYVNWEVAKLLKSLRIEFTRSRANRTQDNALVEEKTERSFASTSATATSPPSTPKRCESSTPHSLNPYLNFHRRCGFATVSLWQQWQTKHFRVAPRFLQWNCTGEITPRSAASPSNACC